MKLALSCVAALLSVLAPTIAFADSPADPAVTATDVPHKASPHHAHHKAVAKHGAKPAKKVDELAKVEKAEKAPKSDKKVLKHVSAKATIDHVKAKPAPKEPGTVIRADLKNAAKNDRHADAKSRALADKTHAELDKPELKKKDALALLHAESHGEPSLSELERIFAGKEKWISRASAGGGSSAVLVKVDAKSSSAKEEKADKLDPKGANVKGGKGGKAPTCFNEPVEIVRGTQHEKLPLTQCDGTVVPKSLDRLSLLAQPTPEARKQKELKEGEKTLDPRLVSRLQTIAEHFRAEKKGLKIELVSGYRPASKGSYHAVARAMDIRIEGVSNEELVSYCKTLIDTGCGYYPNSLFVHVDARDPGTGHVSWIDASGPGETPHYVASWPESAESTKDEDTKPAPKAELPPSDAQSSN
ncbi:MAG: DUF882 domain-containing protein [Polyangiaceae bacterium]|nr:DUF882 domain-containing protein [Polyangiaceae bacterium]